MITKPSLTIAALLLVGSSAAIAQPSVVNIQLRPGNPRTIEVTPNATAVCRNTPTCATEIDFRWVAQPPADPTERIVVKYKRGLYLTADDKPSPVGVDPDTCFDFPGGQNPFTLEYGANKSHKLVFDAASEECPDKVAFFFDISCQGGVDGNCGGVKPLDPGTMVDNGKRN